MGTHDHDHHGFICVPHLHFNLSEGDDTPLQLQRMQYELLEALDGVLEVAHSQSLVVPVGNEDGARAV